MEHVDVIVKAVKTDKGPGNVPVGYGDKDAPDGGDNKKNRKKDDYRQK
jgi:hypothetical protein